MKYPTFLLLIFCLPILSCNGQQYYLIENKPSNDPPPNSSSFQTDILKEVNAYRQSGCKCGAKRMVPTHPLRWNKQLTEAARKHALDNASRQKLDHTGKDGSTVSTRVTKTGYTWQAVAENIAFGYLDIKGVIQGWVQSKGHCLNLMNPDYKEVGIYKKDNYWVMVLATKM